ncbi:putative DNA methylase [Porphyromonas gingivalis TDC60]|nr:putative DNA methylase [Porphyromonas gingivalis TDC60]
MQVAPQGGIYNYFHSLLPPLSLAPFMRRTPLPSISLFCKGLLIVFSDLLPPYSAGLYRKKAFTLFANYKR